MLIFSICLCVQRVSICEFFWLMACAADKPLCWGCLLILWAVPYRLLFLLLLWMGTQNWHNVPFLESASLKKRKRKAMKRIKNKLIKYLKRVIKIICHLVPKVVRDLPLEGSRQYRRRERIPKAGSRREETITEPNDSCNGEFHTIVVGKWCLLCGMWPSHWRWDKGSQFIRAVTNVIAVEKR